MSRGRTATILTLLLLPFALYLGFGTWAMWVLGWFWWLWLLMPACWGLAWLLSRKWRTDILGLTPRELDVAPHWTPRDEQAWELVQARARRVKEFPAARLTEIAFYTDTANELAAELARVYFPNAKDPFASLTIPEILAAAELAAEDLAEMVDKFLPGGHVVTVRHWRGLSKLPGWYETFERWYWPISTLLAPQTVVGRYAASKWILGPVTEAMQANVIAWFYVTYVQEVGRALIELNSGRLRGGAKRFRAARETLAERGTRSAERGADEPQADAGAHSRSGEALRATPPGPPLSRGGAEDPDVRSVTIALAGQVKAGKSSLVNALLGSHSAATDVLPLTSQVTRYRLEVAGQRDALVLLDTAGYGVSGATRLQIEETRVAAEQADLLLLVMDVTSPARQADVDFLRGLADFYRPRLNLKPAPILGVLTHVDLLSPVMEWSPPYDWKQPGRPKERAIHEAVAFNEGQLGPHAEAVVPVSIGGGRGGVYGVTEWLLPAMTALLDEARAVSLVRTLHEEIDRQKVQRILRQCWSVGRQLVRAGIARHERGEQRLGEPPA